MTDQEYRAVQELMITALVHLDAASGTLRSAHMADLALNAGLAAEYRAMVDEHLLAAVELLTAIRSQNFLHESEMPLALA